MPISPEQKAKYPADWKKISERIRFKRAGGHCECTGQCGLGDPQAHATRCRAPHGQYIRRSKSENQHWQYAEFVKGVYDSKFHEPIKVVLTTAHLDRDPTNNAEDNLLAMCQRCHLVYDKHQHQANARRTRLKAKGILLGGAEQEAVQFVTPPPAPPDVIKNEAELQRYEDEIAGIHEETVNLGTEPAPTEDYNPWT